MHVNSDYPYGVTFTLASDIKFVVKTEGVIFIEYIWCKAIQKDGDIIGCHPIGVLVLGLGDAVPIERIYIQAVPGGLLCNGVKGIFLVRINSAVV